MGKKKTGGHAKAIREWTERDLSQAMEANELPRAFEVEDVLHQVSDVLLSGKSPVVNGDSGVGKTAIVYELLRGVSLGNGPECLEGKRILQFSFRHRASGLRRPHDMRPAMQAITDALLQDDCDIVPFFRDVHLAYMYDLEPLLQTLGYRFANPIICEGDHQLVRSLFEYTPELEQFFVMINIDEPSFDTTHRILEQWSEEQVANDGRQYLPEALEEALHLSHRFLARARLPRKAIELLVHVGSLTEAGKRVARADVIDRFCRSHRVPRDLIDPSISLNLAEMEVKFAEHVLGQPEAVKAVVQLIGLIKAGLSDARRPFAVFLFVGATGVGKTLVAQLLAEYLFGSRERMVRFNMADYQKETDAEALFGNIDGENLPRKRGALTQRISGQPFAVLLLDEFEKAHPKVHDRFLQLFDEGTFINGAGELVSCRSMILIATSNTGAELYRGQALGFEGSKVDRVALTRELNRRLAQTFRFELLNRFDQVVQFSPLTREHIRTIALRELEAIKGRTGFRQRKFHLEVDDVVLDWLTAHGYDPHYGARFLRRAIERHVTTALAEVIVRCQAEAGSTLSLSVRQNRIVARLDTSGPSGKRREAVVLPLGTTEQTRTLDSTRLLAEVSDLLRNATRRLDGLEAKRNEASSLLTKMNETGFWDRAAESQETLERYRELDVAIQVGERLAEPLQTLSTLKDAVSENHALLPDLARALEAGARALRDWEERLAEDGAGAVWMVLGKMDPLLPASQWLADLTSMELAWCEKLGLAATVVACEVVDGEVARIVIEAEGPGASALLGMEEGLHRLTRRQASDLRARVEVIPRQSRPAARLPHIRPIRRRKGPFDIDIAFCGLLELPGRGLKVELLGDNQEMLSQLLADLMERWSQHGPSAPDAARVYGRDGSGARDPRTGAVVSRLKDVLRGNLDRFLEAWRQGGRLANQPKELI